jgi:hypothetical protein
MFAMLACFAQTAATFCQKMIITLAFEKKRQLFAEIWQKSKKIVIIT